jgi:3-oxoacyl-[acyl-carrier protein] reductase
VPFTLEGKAALVTGAARGIGRAIATRLAAAGASVLINDLDEEAAREAAAALPRAQHLAGDVTRPDFPERLVAAMLERFGSIDILVNNAGYTWDSVIQKMTDAQWDAILDVHLKAPFRILRAAQPVISGYAKGEGGTVTRKVVNISSIAGLGGNAGQSNYSTAKAGIVGLTKTLAKEWGRYNVTVNAVAFGYIQTRLTATDGADRIDVAGNSIKVGMSEQLKAMTEQMIPLGRAGTPKDAAGAVYLMCLPESDYISAQVVICGGGFFI